MDTDTLNYLIEAAARGDVNLVLAFLLMFAVSFVRKIAKEHIKPENLPHVSVLISVAFFFLLFLMSGVNWQTALANATLVGLAGSGVYSAGGKKFFKKKKE